MDFHCKAISTSMYEMTSIVNMLSNTSTAHLRSHAHSVLDISALDNEANRDVVKIASSGYAGSDLSEGCKNWEKGAY